LKGSRYVSGNFTRKTANRPGRRNRRGPPTRTAREDRRSMFARTLPVLQRVTVQLSRRELMSRHRRWAHIHRAVIELVPAPIVRPALEVCVRDLPPLGLHGVHLSIVTNDVRQVRKLHRGSDSTQVVDRKKNRFDEAPQCCRLCLAASRGSGQEMQPVNRSAQQSCCRR